MTTPTGRKIHHDSPKESVDKKGKNEAERRTDNARGQLGKASDAPKEKSWKDKAKGLFKKDAPPTAEKVKNLPIEIVDVKGNCIQTKTVPLLETSTEKNKKPLPPAKYYIQDKVIPQDQVITLKDSKGNLENRQLIYLSGESTPEARRAAANKNNVVQLINNGQLSTPYQNVMFVDPRSGMVQGEKKEVFDEDTKEKKILLIAYYPREAQYKLYKAALEREIGLLNQSIQNFEQSGNKHAAAIFKLERDGILDIIGEYQLELQKLEAIEAKMKLLIDDKLNKAIEVLTKRIEFLQNKPEGEELLAQSTSLLNDLKKIQERHKAGEEVKDDLIEMDPVLKKSSQDLTSFINNSKSKTT